MIYMPNSGYFIKYIFNKKILCKKELYRIIRIPYSDHNTCPGNKIAKKENRKFNKKGYESNIRYNTNISLKITLPIFLQNIIYYIHCNFGKSMNQPVVYRDDFLSILCGYSLPTFQV